LLFGPGRRIKRAEKQVNQEAASPLAYGKSFYYQKTEEMEERKKPACKMTGRK
jgi:hypothetical protein